MSSDIATVTTLKTSLAQTLEYVEYHLRRGIGHMYLYFDDPDDPALSLLQGDERLTCVACSRGHWDALGVCPTAPVQVKQHANATAAFAQAAEADASWLVHIDADELLYAKSDLIQVFESAPSTADVILFPVKEALPQRWIYERPLREISFFKYDPTQPWRADSIERSTLQAVWHRLRSHGLYRRRQVAQRMACMHPSLVAGFYLGHTFGKAATRTTLAVESIGNHLPKPESERSLRIHACHKGTVLHFDCMGYAHWKQKWMRRVTDASLFDLDRFRDDRRRIWNLFCDAAESGEPALRELYAALHHLSVKERLVLQGLGFIQRIRLDRWLPAVPPLESHSRPAQSGRPLQG